MNISRAVLCTLLTAAISPCDARSESPEQKQASRKIDVQDGEPLREYKSNVVLQVKVGCARTFNVNSVIMRTAVGDPAVASPVVVCENQLMLIGISPGHTSIILWGMTDYFEAEPRARVPNKVATIELETLKGDVGSSPDSTTALFVNVGEVKLQECKLTPEARARYEKSTLMNGSESKGKESPKPSAASKSESSMPSDTDKVKQGQNRGHIVVDVRTSHIRAFKLPHTIRKIFVADASVAEPVQLSANEVQIIGRKPGNTTLTIVSNKDHISLDVRVPGEADKKNSSSMIPPVVVDAMKLEEYPITKSIDLQISQPKMFAIERAIIRAAIANPEIAGFVPGSNSFYLTGKSAGTTTVFLWDNLGNTSGFRLRVGQSQAAIHDNSQLKAPPAGAGFAMEIETWEGDRKIIQYWPPKAR